MRCEQCHGPHSDELDGAGGESGPGLAPAPDSDSEEPGRAAAAGRRAKVLPVLAPSSGGNQPWERSNNPVVLVEYSYCASSLKLPYKSNKYNI